MCVVHINERKTKDTYNCIDDKNLALLLTNSLHLLQNREGVEDMMEGKARSNE